MESTQKQQNSHSTFKNKSMRGSMPRCLSCRQQHHRFPLLSTHRESPNPKALIMGPMGMKGPGGARCPQRCHCVQNGTGEFSRSKSLPTHQRRCQERNGRSQGLPRPVERHGPPPCGARVHANAM